MTLFFLLSYLIASKSPQSFLLPVCGDHLLPSCRFVFACLLENSLSGNFSSIQLYQAVAFLSFILLMNLDMFFSLTKLLEIVSSRLSLGHAITSPVTIFPGLLLFLHWYKPFTLLSASSLPSSPYSVIASFKTGWQEGTEQRYVTFSPNFCSLLKGCVYVCVKEKTTCFFL